MPWFKRFPQPILLPNGDIFLTLRDAADFIAALPEAERARVDWRIASEALKLATEREGEVALAYAATVRALGLLSASYLALPGPPSSGPAKLRIVR